MSATLEIPVGIAALTLTASVYPDGSDTAAATGTSLAEATNRKGYYSGTFTGLSGLHFVRVLSGTSNVWTGWAVLATSGTVIACDSRLEALNLDAAITTRMATFAYTAPLDAAGTRTALGLASANLDTQLAAIASSITALNNLSALANLFGPPILEIPDSSSSLYPFTFVVRDAEGKLVDLDASPTIAATNAAGTSRAANLSAVSHPSTGVYTFTYSVASNATEEGLRIVATGAVSSEARRADAVVAVADYDAVTMIAAIGADLAAVKTILDARGTGYGQLPVQNINGYVDVNARSVYDSEPAASGLADLGNNFDHSGSIPAAIVTDGLDANSVNAAAVTKIQNGLATSTALGAVATSASAAATSAASADGKATTILARLGAWTGSGLNTILGAITAMCSKAATKPSDITGTYDPATDSLEAGAEAVGEGGTPVIITPVAGSITNPRWINADWGQVMQGSAPSSVYSVVDQTGAAVDLSAKSLRLTVYTIADGGNTITGSYKLESGSGITVGGASHNQVTVSLSATNTATAGSFVAELWNVTDSLPLAKGRLTIIPALKNLP